MDLIHSLLLHPGCRIQHIQQAFRIHKASRVDRTPVVCQVLIQFLRKGYFAFFQHLVNLLCMVSIGNPEYPVPLHIRELHQIFVTKFHGGYNSVRSLISSPLQCGKQKTDRMKFRPAIHFDKGKRPEIPDLTDKRNSVLSGNTPGAFPCKGMHGRTDDRIRLSKPLIKFLLILFHESAVGNHI